MSYSAIELNDDDEPAPEPDEPITLPPQVRGDDGFKVSPRERADEPARSSKKRRSKSKDGTVIKVLGDSAAQMQATQENAAAAKAWVDATAAIAKSTKAPRRSAPTRR